MTDVAAQVKLELDSGCSGQRQHRSPWVPGLLMFQVTSVGPMLGQLGHFRRAAPEKIPYAIERYQKEQERIYKVLDGRLAESEHLPDEYSIADIATFPWISGATRLGVDTAPYPNLARWEQAIKARPAVTRAYAAKIKP
ncbi:glutathione S-transferase C-terminal domain-containing protein [Sorangium sp. So ce1000]|uniref:glutathione S-transferase C-terminal domain-containing protein n=1 Tax=Sorangium sp. So ce1000 TaxID=3133325 RepID=UPI003F5E5CA7